MWYGGNACEVNYEQQNKKARRFKAPEGVMPYASQAPPGFLRLAEG
jgi:hypothetical protein